MSTDKSTDSQKEIFSRLHKIFSDTNQSLAYEKAMRQSLEAEVKRLSDTFEEQNETLRRYEETFGALPPVAYAAAPSVPAPMAPTWPTGSQMAAQPPAMPMAPPAAPFADAMHKGIYSASALRSHIRMKFHDQLGRDAGEFLYSKIFAGDAL